MDENRVEGANPCGFCATGSHEFCERKGGVIKGAAAGKDWYCPCHLAGHS